MVFSCTDICQMNSMKLKKLADSTAVNNTPRSSGKRKIYCNNNVL